MRSTTIVDAFWDEVWNAHEPNAVARFVADDVVVEAGGQEIAGQENVKNWVKAIPRSRQRLARRHHRDLSGRGRHPRHLHGGSEPRDQQRHPRHRGQRQAHRAHRHRRCWTIEDEKLQRGWVEQASFELYRYSAREVAASTYRVRPARPRDGVRVPAQQHSHLGLLRDRHADGLPVHGDQRRRRPSTPWRP